MTATGESHIERMTAGKGMAEKKKQGQLVEEDDWEIVDDADVDEDYVVVRRFR